MKLPARIAREHLANLWPHQNICIHDFRVPLDPRHQTSSDHIFDSAARPTLIFDSPNDVFPATIYWFHRSSHGYGIHRDQLRMKHYRRIRLSLQVIGVSSPFCICATFFDISRMISRRHFSHLETSVHSDARYGRRSLSPVSASFAARHRASVVLKNSKLKKTMENNENKRHRYYWLPSKTAAGSVLTLLFPHFAPENNCKGRKGINLRRLGFSKRIFAW